MRRVVVLGARGHFGRTLLNQLRSRGIEAHAAGRRAQAGLRVDANDLASIQDTLQAGDVVVDVAGPFQNRSTALLMGAVEVGFDVVDLNDSLAYAQQIYTRRHAIEAAGIRYVVSASTVSAVSAAVLRLSGINSPRAFTAIMAPATRHTANVGSARSLIHSLSKPIQVWQGNALAQVAGPPPRRTFQMPSPVGRISGLLFETADALLLPMTWPTLEDVRMFVSPRIVGLNTLLPAAARHSWLRTLLERNITWGTRVSRLLGKSTGGIGYEIEGHDGHIERRALLAAERSYFVATLPAVLVVQAMLDGASPPGVVNTECYVEPQRLLSELEDVGIRIATY